MRIMDYELDNGMDLIVIFVFYFYFFFFFFFYVYLISRGIGTADQCSCWHADKRSYLPNLEKYRRGCESKRHVCVVLLESYNKRQSNLKLDSVHLFIWRSRYEELVIFAREELVKLVKKETRQNSLEVILNLADKWFRNYICLFGNHD